MIRRRFEGFALDLELRTDEFIAAPRQEQRQWLVDKAVQEVVDELQHLNVIAPRLVPGRQRAEMHGPWDSATPEVDEESLILEGQQVMQAWERPLMRRLARRVSASHGDVLEIGFGLGISAGFIQAEGVRSHTIIELNRAVAQHAQEWRSQRQDADVTVLAGSWQDILPRLGKSFDGILWDAYPTSEEEFSQTVLRDGAVAEHFFAEAAEHLRPSGVFTYYSNERDSLSRRHQRSLLRHFESFMLEPVRGLQPPADCEYWWSNEMVVVSARRGPCRSAQQ